MVHIPQVIWLADPSRIHPAQTPAAERDESEFARLSQLGDVLGLTQMDVYQASA